MLARNQTAGMNRPDFMERLRVLDLSPVLASPFYAMIVADLSAEVIKVESPNGDDSRHFGPWYIGESTKFQLINRSRNVVTMHLKIAEWRERLLVVVRRSDVVIEYFRPGLWTGWW